MAPAAREPPSCCPLQGPKSRAYCPKPSSGATRRPAPSRPPLQPVQIERDMV